jgi:hypothetical protein
MKKFLLILPLLLVLSACSQDGEGLFGGRTGPTKLNAISDVSVPAPNDGEALTYVAANGQWESVAGAGSGDVTSVGDCAAGACLDGSSDGGTYIYMYDGDSNYTGIAASNTASDLLFYLPTGYGSDGQVLETNGDGTLTWTTALTASSTNLTLSGMLWGDVTGNLTGNVTGDVSGNAGTATALAANGANCGAGEYPLGVDASGAVESCTDATTEINTEIANVLDGTDAFTDFNGKVIDTDNLVADSADDTIVDFSSVTCTDITMTDCGQITSTGDMSVTGDITASATSTANVFSPGSDCYIKVSTSTTGIEIGCY